MKRKTDDDPTVREEDAAITAQDLKTAVNRKTRNKVEDKKAKEALHELKFPERNTLK